MSLLIALPLLFTAPPVEEPRFVARGAGPSAETVLGTLQRITGDAAAIRTITGDASIANLISLRQVGKPVPPFPTGPMLITTAGDRVPGRITGGDDRGLSFQPDLARGDPAPVWKVPYSAVAVVWRSTPPSDTPLDPRNAAWIGMDRTDSLRRLNGDVSRGAIESVGEVVRFKLLNEAAVRSFPLPSVSAIAFNPALSRLRKPPEVYVHIVLANGSRLDLKSVSVASGHLEGRTLFDSPVRVKLGEVVAMDVQQGKAIDLVTVKPKSRERTDFLGVARAFDVDPALHSQAIKLAGSEGDSTYDDGLITSPRSRLVYDLAGKYHRFDTSLGLEASTTIGSAVVRIFVDGKEMLPPGRGTLTPGVSRNLSVPVTGAKELTLEIDFGPSGGVRSEVLWGNPRLVE